MRLVRQLILVSTITIAGLSLAQSSELLPELPPELLNPVLQLDSDSIRFCYYPDGATAQLDILMADAIAGALLLNAELFAAKGPISIPGIDFIPISEDDLFLFLSNDCDAFMGFTLASGVYPEWLTFSRPYARTGFKAITRVGGIESLADLPPGSIIGTVMMSEFDMELANLIGTQPEERRWRRFPYPTAQLAVERLFDETVDVAVSWEPTMNQVIAESVEQYVEVNTASLGSPSRLLGVAMLSNQSFLRTIIDTALSELSQSGALDGIFAEANFPGYIP